MSKFFKSMFLLLSAGVFAATGWAETLVKEWTYNATTNPEFRGFYDGEDLCKWGEGDVTITLVLQATSATFDTLLFNLYNASDETSRFKMTPNSSFNGNKARYELTGFSDTTGGHFTAARVATNTNNANKSDYASLTGTTYTIGTNIYKFTLSGYSVASGTFTGLSSTFDFPANANAGENESHSGKQIDLFGAQDYFSPTAISTGGNLTCVYIKIEGTKYIPPTSTSATISGQVDASLIQWDPSEPTDTMDATLTVSEAAQLTMNTDVTAHKLEVTGADLTVATDDSHKLTAAQTTINANTTVNTGAANLGAVSITEGNILTVKETPTNVYSSLGNYGALCLDAGDATTPLTINNNNALGKILLASGAVVKMTATGGNKVYNIEGVADAEVKPELRLHSGQDWGVTIPGSAFKNVKLVLPEKNSNDGSGTYSFWLTPSTLANDASVDLEIKGGQGLTFENVNSVTAVFGSFVTNGAFSGTTVQTGTGEISGSGGTTNITVTNSGAGSFTVARAYGSLLTIGSNGRVTVAEGGSLTGAVSVTGALTYATNATATNTITNNGMITADTATVDLTGATISGSGTYGVTNGGTLILKAGTENGASVTDGTLKLLLSQEQLIDGHTANVAQGTVVTFIKAGAEGYETVSEDVTVYEVPAKDGETFTATVGTGDGQVTAWTGVGEDGFVYRNTTLAIHFTANGQTFTFDNTLGVALTSLTVTAEAGVTGCTIAFPATEGLVIATNTAINADVTVTGQGALGAVTVAGGKTVDVKTFAFTSLVKGEGEGNAIVILDATNADISHATAFTVPAGVTLQTKGTVTFSGNNTIANSAKLEVLSGTTSFGGTEKGLAGNIAIAQGATLVNTRTSDALNYDATLTVDVYGTLNMGSTRWTMGANNTLNVYSGATITGSGQEENGALDWYRAATFNVKKSNTDGTNAVTISANLRTRDQGNIKFMLEEEMTATMSGVIYGAKAVTVNGAGTLVFTAAQSHHSGALTIDGGTLRIDVNKGDNAAEYVQAIPEGKVISVAQGAILDLYNGYGYFATTGAGLTKVTGDFYYGISGNDDAGNPRTNTIGSALEVTSNGTLRIRNWRTNYQLAPSALRLDGTIVSEGYNNQNIKDFTVAPAVLSGNGTIGSDTLPLSLTLPENATLDVTAGVLNVTGAVTLPAAMTVKITEVQNVNGTIPLLNAANVTIPDGQVVTVMVGENKGTNRYAVTHEDGVLKLTVTERVVVENVTATVNGGTVSYNEIINAVEGDLADDFTLTINFGDGAAGTFTFDNAEAVTVGTIAIQGTAGGTIVMADGAEITYGTLVLDTTVAADAAFYAANTGAIEGTGKLCLASGELTLDEANTYTGGTDIAADATLTITNAGALGAAEAGAITGAGTLVCNNVLPTNRTGLTTGTPAEGETLASGWLGTVELKDFVPNAKTGYTFHNLGNSASTLELNNFAQSNSDVYLNENNTLNLKTFKVTGDNYITNGNSNRTITVNGTLDGTGSLNFKGGPSELWKFARVSSTFGGTFMIAQNQVIVLGDVTLSYNQRWYYNNVACNGTIFVATPVTIAEEKNWTSPNGVIVTRAGTISGAGTIGSNDIVTTLTLEADATLDVTAGVLNVTGAVTLPAAMTVKITEVQNVNGTIPLLNAANVTIPDGQVVTVMVGENKGTNRYAVTHEDGVLKLTVTERVVVENVTATVNGGTVSYNEIINAVEGDLADDFTLTINFGDGAAGTFTFDNAEAVTVGTIAIQGTAGGTIMKTGAGTVTATATTIAAGCTVTVPANTAVLGAVEVEAGAKIVVVDVATITSASGAGTIETSVYPTTKTATNVSDWSATSSIAGLTDSENWTGTLKINKGGTLAQEVELAQDALRFDLLGNANSTIEIAEGTKLVGYFGLMKTGPNTGWTADAKMVINGTLHSNNGFSDVVTAFSGPLTGSGTVKLTHNSPYDRIEFSGDVTGFTGTMVIDSASRAIVVGPNTVAKENGKIVIAAAVKYGTAAWTATNGIVIKDTGSLDINGLAVTVKELNSAGTITDTAETKGSITVQGGAVNVTGTCTATVKVDLSTYFAPTTFVVPEGAPFEAINTLASHLSYDAGTKTISVIQLTTTLADELIWLPVGDSITEGESDMGHADRGDGNSRGGYRYQLWKLMEELGQETRSVGFRTGHCGTTESNDTDWAWHAGLYGGTIKCINTKGSHWFNVESALETAGYPDVITVLLGINDLSFLGNDSEAGIVSVYEDWTAMVEKYATLRPNSKILVSTLLTVVPGNKSDDRYGPFNDMMRRDAAAKAGAFQYPNVILTDVCLNAFNNTFDAGNFKGDGIHPNEYGSVKVASAFHLGMKDVLAAITNDPLTIVHAHNAAANTLTVRLNKAVTSVDGLTATITGTTFADNEVNITLSNGVLNETNKRVITFTLNDALVNGDYIVAVNGTVNGGTVALTATGAAVELLGSGAAQNVKPDFINGFKHRKTITLGGNNANYAESEHASVAGADADATLEVGRVGYYMELQRAGEPAQFVWVSMNAFAEEAKLGIPTVDTGAHKTIVSGLNVFANRGNFAKEIKGSTGVIEFTPWSWTAAEEDAGSTYPYEGKDGLYGWNDTLEMSAGTLKGGMQIARIVDMTSSNRQKPAAELLFAYNNYNCGTTTDVGIGSFVTHRNNSGSAYPAILFDWTNFSSTTGYTTYMPDAYEVKKIEIWVASALETVSELTIDATECTTWSEVLAQLDAESKMPATNPSLVLDFGNADGEAVLGAFTFDSASNLTLASFTIQGTNGGTITTSTSPVIATETTIKGGCAVTVPASTAQLGAVTVEADATIIVADTTTITSASGAGTIETSVYPTTGTINYNAPASIANLNDATKWAGTLKLNKAGEIAADGARFDVLGNADSAIEITAGTTVKGYFSLDSWDTATDIILNGELNIRDGFSGKTYNLTGGLSGNGALVLNASGTPNDTVKFCGDISFTGSIANSQQKRSVIFGTANRVDGKIVVAVPMTIAAEKTWTSVNGVVVKSTGAIAGAGTIGSTLTLEAGATIDTTKGVVTANTMAALPASLKVVVETLPTEGTPVTILNTTAFTAGVPTVALTLNGVETEDYILATTAETVELRVAPWTTVTTATASGDVNTWSEVLASMEANRQRFDTTADPSLVIDFGSGNEPGTFTFDMGEGDPLDGNAVFTLGTVTIQGSAGGTVEKTGTANISANATVVNTNVEIAQNTMELGTTTLAANYTLTVNDAAALGEAANFAADATSTVKLVNVNNSRLDLAKLVPNGSNLTLNNVKAYIYDCTIGTLTLEGDFQMNNGTTTKKKTQCITVNALAGAGTFIGHQGTEVYVAVNVKNWTNFKGSIDLSHEKSAGTIFFFGAAPQRFTDAASNAYNVDDAQVYFENDYGTVYVTAGTEEAVNTVATAVTSTWKLQKLVVEDGAAFQIKGWATIATSCTGAVTVENGGVLDLRTLTDAQLETTNVTVKAGGRLLVNTGATVPNNIVFETDSILGVATKHVEDVGNATLTVNVNGTAAANTTIIKGYHVDGVTELDNWAKNNETSSEGEFKFNFDPVFDGELCWWAYEFDNEVNTSPESNLGPISTGRDKGRMNFDGRGDSNRVCQDNEYLDHGDGTKAICVASSPWRDVSGGYPKAFTAAMYGTLTSSRNRIIMGFGSSYNQKYTIALVTGASTDEVRLVLQKGWNENNQDYPEDAVITLATTTVPNAVTENHLFAFSYEQFDYDEDKTLDSTRIIFYVDGEKYQPFTAKAIIPLGNGFQMGSIHGGWHNSLTRMNGDDVNCTMEYLRIYDQILPESVWTAMSNEYSYMSKNGRATRTIVEGQDATWNENTEWTQIRAVKDGNGDYVLDAEDHVTFDNGTAVEKPDHGENVGTQVVLNVSGENTLYLNEFYSNPIQEGEVSKLYYERLEINPVEGGDEDSLTLWAGRLNEDEAAENKTKQSAVITVQGYTKINTNVTMAHNVAFLSGPVAVAEGKWLHFDFSGFDVMKVPSMPVTYRLTGFLDEDTRTRVTSTAPADPVNARSIDLGYKTTVNQYTFTVNRYPVTAYFTADDDPMVVARNNDTTINFNSLYYIWQGNEWGKQMNWEAEAVDPQGNPIVENTLAKFVSLDAETQQEKMVTVTLATNDVDPITLTLDEAALTKETTPAGTDGEGNPTDAVVENMLGEQQLIVGEKVIVNYTGDDAAELAPYVKEAVGMVKAKAMTATTWRGNLTLDNGEETVAIAGTNTVSGKLVLGKSITLAEGATISATDADFTAVKTITVDYEEAVAAGTYKVVGLEAGHTAKSLIGCVVTAVKEDTSTVEWTEAEGTLVVVRADGLYVVARPDVTVTTNETTKVIKNEDLTLPLARRAAELSATSVSLTGVVNMAGKEVDAPVADAAEVFTNVAFDMNETVVDGVVTAKLKYDFGVSQINIVTIESVQYVVAELIVSNNVDIDQNNAAYADGTTIDVTVKVGNAEQDVTVEAAANMMGETVAPAAELPASTRYVRFQMPTGNGTFEIKARAAKKAAQQQ